MGTGPRAPATGRDRRDVGCGESQWLPANEGPRSCKGCASVVRLRGQVLPDLAAQLPAQIIVLHAKAACCMMHVTVVRRQRVPQLLSEL